MAWFVQPTPFGSGCRFPLADPALWPNTTTPAAVACTSTLGDIVAASHPGFAGAHGFAVAYAAFWLALLVTEAVGHFVCSAGHTASASSESRKTVSAQLLRGLLISVSAVVIAIDPGGLRGVVPVAVIYIASAVHMATLLAFMTVYALLLIHVTNVLTRSGSGSRRTSAVSAERRGAGAPPTTPEAAAGTGPAAPPARATAAPSPSCLSRLLTSAVPHGCIIWPDLLTLITLVPLRAAGGSPHNYPYALAAYCWMLLGYFAVTGVLTLVPGAIILRHVRAAWARETAAGAVHGSPVGAVTAVTTVATLAATVDSPGGRRLSDGLSVVPSSASAGGGASSAVHESRLPWWQRIWRFCAAVCNLAQGEDPAARRRHFLLWIALITPIGGSLAIGGCAIFVRQALIAGSAGRLPEEFGGALRGDAANWPLVMVSNGLVPVWVGAPFPIFILARWRWLSIAHRCLRRFCCRVALCGNRGRSTVYVVPKPVRTAPAAGNPAPDLHTVCELDDAAAATLSTAAAAHAV